MRKKLFSRVLITGFLASSCLFAGAMNKSGVLSDLAKIPFVKKTGFKLLDVKDMGNVYAVKATHPKVPKLTIFITKDKKVVIIGNGFTKGKKIEFPTDMSKYTKEALFTVGNGTKDYYVFTDPECPYCQRFEKQLKNLNKDAKLHVFLFPLSFHKHSISMSKFIISQKTSKARAKAIEDIANGDTKYKNAKYTDAENKALSASISKMTKIAETLGVRGTPTVYDAKGRDIPWPSLLSKK